MSMIAKDSKMRWTGEILHHRRCQDQKEENFDLDLFRERQICGFTSAEEEKRPRSPDCIMFASCLPAPVLPKYGKLLA